MDYLAVEDLLGLPSVDWDKPRERQRFTIAHELGHLVLSPTRKMAAENAANRFASVFLMPAEVLWAEVGKLGKQGCSKSSTAGELSVVRGVVPAGCFA